MHKNAQESFEREASWKRFHGRDFCVKRGSSLQLCLVAEGGEQLQFLRGTPRAPESTWELALESATESYLAVRAACSLTEAFLRAGKGAQGLVPCVRGKRSTTQLHPAHGKVFYLLKKKHFVSP